MNAETAWKIINAFPTMRPDREKCQPMQAIDRYHAILNCLKGRWIIGDSRFLTFTAYDMGRILSDRWCNLYASGNTVGSEQTLSECWDIIGLDVFDLWNGRTGANLNGDGSVLVSRLILDLSGLRNYSHDDSVEIICVDPD